MTTPAPRTDIVTTALNRLTSAFRPRSEGDRKVNAGLLAAYASHAQNVENTINDVILGRILPALGGTAQGAQLDTIGAIVGEKRNGRDDAHFAAAIPLRVVINRCTGTSDSVTNVIAFGAGIFGIDWDYRETNPASYHVVLYGGDLPSATELSNAIQQIKPAGFRARVEWAPWGKVSTLIFGSRTGNPPSATGLGHHGAATPAFYFPHVLYDS